MKRYPKYKDSGVSWIGEIPEHWEVRRMKFLFTERTEKNHPDEPILCATQAYGVIPQSMYDNRVVVVNSGFENLKFVEEGDFVISLRSFQGGIEYAHYQGIISAAYTILRSNGALVNEYSRYLFKSYPFIQLLKTCVKGIREGQNINYEMLKNNFLVIPPADEQSAIVSYLDKKSAQIDRFIASTEAEIEALKELKQAEIARLVTRGVNPDVPMKDSGIAWIGEIPEYWEVKRIASLFLENKTKNSDSEFDHALKFKYGRLVPKDEKGDVSDLIDTYVAYTKIKKNDIAINCLNLNYDFISQRVAIAKEDGILTSAYLIMSPRLGVNADYYSYFFKTMDNKKMFHGMGTGIRLTLSYTELKKQYIVVPPASEQSVIVSAIDTLSSKIDRMVEQLNAQISHLKELKQRIISDAVTGKIDVSLSPALPRREGGKRANL